MIDDVTKELIASAAKAHDSLRRELAKLRAGRANADLLSNVRVDYYGSVTPLPQMANISAAEARLLIVKPWDKSALKSIEKALRESELGLNPQADGDIIRVPLPPLTEERRKEFQKLARKYGEDCKVAIRKCRHDANDMLGELAGSASEDEIERAKKKVDELVADAGRVTDKLVSEKEKDIMEV